LPTYAHNPELQTITAPPLISTIHKSPQRPLRRVPTFCVFTSRSLATASNSGDFSVSRAEVLSSQPHRHNSLIAPTVQFLGTDHIENTVLLLHSCPLTQERFSELLLRNCRGADHRKRRSSVAFVSVEAGTCLPSCCRETAAARTTENTVLLLLHAYMLWALDGNIRCL
jgi:hypothetical protein